MLLVFFQLRKPFIYNTTVQVLDISIYSVSLVLIILALAIFLLPLLYVWKLQSVKKKVALLAGGFLYSASIILLVLFKSSILLLFSLPTVGNEAIIGYANFFGFSIIAEPCIIIAPLLVPFLVFGIMNWDGKGR